jgi:hypothetical protein
MKTRPLQNDYAGYGHRCGKYQSPAQAAPESLARKPKTWSGRPQGSFAKSLEQCFFHADRRALALKCARQPLQAFCQLGLFVKAQGAP